MCVFAGEENSRVQAHIDGDEFSAHILTDEAEYNVEVRICGINIEREPFTISQLFLFKEFEMLQ